MKTNRLNVKDLVYCLLLTDDETAVTYDVVKSLAPVMTIDIQPSQATGVLYGNGAQQENIGKITGVATKLEVNKVPIEVRAEILGHKFDNGVMITNTEDEAPYIALGYRVECTNGCDEYVWLLKGRAQEIASTAQQQTDKINFSTDKLDINFIPRDYDGHLKFDGDTSNDNFTSAQAAAWFAQGPETYPVPESSEPTE